MATRPSEPLLGTPYLLSQSTSSSTSSPARTHVSPALCSNLSAFKRLLAQSRLLDDAITTRLNRASALSRRNSGIAAPDPGSECVDVWNELVERWDERGKVLSYCDTVLAQQSGALDPRDKRIEEKGLSAEKGELGRGRATQAELQRQQLHLDFATERIIRQRTLSLLLSRCPTLSTTSTPEGLDPPAPPVPRAIGQELDEEERRRARGRDERGGVRWA
ncbi:hypothetical protein JCM10212_005302 [Sporobolomyces blumeae]